MADIILSVPAHQADRQSALFPMHFQLKFSNRPLFTIKTIPILLKLIQYGYINTIYYIFYSWNILFWKPVITDY
jgi:hypothetical protein